MTAGDLKRQFGTAVRNTRTELHISQEELADRSGLHRTYISDVERGARNLSLESIEKLAGALELSICRLFEKAFDGEEKRVEILLVEDVQEDVELTLHALRRAKLSNPIHVARDGAEALDFLFATGHHASRQSANPPQFILLDLHLPKISGLEVLRRIKADKRTEKIPVVVLTSSQDDAHLAECRQLGVQTYLTKPVEFKNFSEATRQLQFEWALMKCAREE